MPFTATWMDLEIIIVSEINQAEKDKYSVITYMRNIKNNLGESIHKTETDSNRKQTTLYLPNGRGKVGKDQRIWD